MQFSVLPLSSQYLFACNSSVWADCIWPVFKQSTAHMEYANGNTENVRACARVCTQICGRIKQICKCVFTRTCVAGKRRKSAVAHGRTGQNEESRQDELHAITKIARHVLRKISPKAKQTKPIIISAVTK
eukprot:6210654-Pleurochrysis_carterae.AAC.1